MSNGIEYRNTDIKFLYNSINLSDISYLSRIQMFSTIDFNYSLIFI